MTNGHSPGTSSLPLGLAGIRDAKESFQSIQKFNTDKPIFVCAPALQPLRVGCRF